MKTNNLPTILFCSFLLVVALFGADIQYAKRLSSVSVSLVKAETTVEVLPTPTSTPVPTDIVGYIEYKFGDKAIDAFTVLQGKGAGTCAENRTLDPYQDNDNRTWGGVGKDVGYWQINTVYHPTVTEECARDVKCSTDYAFKLFTARGNNFSAWTCGKHYDI